MLDLPKIQATGHRTAPKWARKAANKPSRQARATAATPIAINKNHGSVEQHAHAIAEKIVPAWYHASPSHDFVTPLGIVAALALIQADKKQRDAQAQRILALPAHELPKLYAEMWASMWLRHPSLITMARPLIEWTERDDLSDAELNAIHVVTEVALTQGLLELTADPDPWVRSAVDVLGPLLVNLRSAGQRKANAEIHTPSAVAALLAATTITPPYPPRGGWISDPCCGTGSLLRAMAHQLRESGIDPRDYRWYANDIDPLAAAAMAVNAIVWDLGPTLVSCGNGLDGGLFERALTQHAEITEHRDHIATMAGTAMAMKKTLALFNNDPT